MRFLRFEPKFGHAVSHCQCSKICPKLPKTAKIYLKMKLWNTTKNRDFSVFQKNKIKNCTCRGGIRAYFYHLDFQSKNFSYAIFIVKKRALYVNFSIPPCGNLWFSQGSTPCVGMRFCGHEILWAWDFVNMYLTNPGTRIWSPSIHTYSKKWFFWPPKPRCTPWALGRIFFFQLWTLWSCKRYRMSM
jgi:hypothetical protein